jgi:hypothetical protein
MQDRTPAPSLSAPNAVRRDHLAFLRRCVQSLWRPEALAEAQALTGDPAWRWDGLLDAARRGRVSPLLHDRLREVDWAPAPLLASLKQDYFANAVRVMRMLHELETVLAALTAASIPHMVLKGAALGEAVYHNVAVRPLSDLDLLVHREDAVMARRVIEDLGYAPYHPEMRPDALIEDYKEFALVKAAGTGSQMSGASVVDLHWRLLPDYVEGGAEAMAWFWATAMRLDEGKVTSLTLGPEAQVLYLAAHLSLSHGDTSTLGQLVWLADVALLLGPGAGLLDWSQLFERARAYGLVRPLRETLLHLHDAWNVTLPPTALDRLTDLRPSAHEAWVERVLAANGATQGRLHAGFFAVLASLPSWRQRFVYVGNHLFPSRAYMARRYGVRSVLALPFVYLYRGMVGFHHMIKLAMLYLRRER